MAKVGGSGNGIDIGEFLAELDAGRVYHVLGDQMGRVVDLVQTHGGKGELTLKLSLTKEGDRAVCEAKIDTKAPHEPVGATLFFFGRDGGLTREDPRQLSLRELAPQKPKEPTHGH